MAERGQQGMQLARLQASPPREEGTVRAQDIMTRNPSCVTPETPAREAARLMKDEDVGVVPVVEGNGSRTLVGIVTDRDLAVRIVADGQSADTPVRSIMTADRLATGRSDADVDDVMERMAAEKVRRIPIVDERGDLVGIVSQADVARKAKNENRVEDTVERISQPGGSHSH